MLHARVRLSTLWPGIRALPRVRLSEVRRRIPIRTPSKSIGDPTPATQLTHITLPRCYVNLLRSTFDAGAVPWSQDNLLSWPGRPEQHHRVDAQPANPPIVICPGFGNCTADYATPFGKEDDGIEAALRARGFKVFTMPVERGEWGRVLRALLTREYWSRRCTTDPAYTWYLVKLKATIDAARLATGSEQVDLVGHSAGGWLARAFIGDAKYFDGSNGASAGAGGGFNRAVRSLVSLGSPHLAPPPHVRDMTGGTLTWVNERWPGAYFGEDGLKYVCVAGRSVRGHGRAPRRSISRYAYGSYKQVCGKGHMVAGDGVVPIRSACLEGAEHLLLDGVFHSMSQLGSYSKAGSHVWYGDERVIDTWLPQLV